MCNVALQSTYGVGISEVQVTGYGPAFDMLVSLPPPQYVCHHWRLPVGCMVIRYDYSAIGTRKEGNGLCTYIRNEDATGSMW